MTIFQAIIIGFMQGVTELFPISSLGHSVLVADLFGWNNILSAQDEKGSSYLTFLVAVHVATAIALFIFYRKTWYKIIKGFFSSVRERQATTVYEKLAWLLIVATIPAGLLGLLFESFFRSLFAKPLIAAVFLVVNGFILLLGDHLHKRQKQAAESLQSSSKSTSRNLTYKKSVFIGATQSLALIAGISRSGVTMVGGLLSGLTYESAARFAFLLATPVIFLAGVYKLPELVKPASRVMLLPTLVGAAVAGIAAYLAVRFLDKYFQDKRLWPFAVYCFVFGGLMIILQFVR